MAFFRKEFINFLKLISNCLGIIRSVGIEINLKDRFCKKKTGDIK